MSIKIIHGNALALPLEDNTVDLVVTSPPYFRLRSYTDNGEHYEGQIGSEATPAEFVDALIAATREMVRVLKPSGSIWVNLGDKYASSGGHGAGATSQRATRSQYVEQIGRSERNETGVATKSLIGIPWRYAIRCIDELGLILRAEVIWSKPNGLPESVTDRVRRSHEQWFHFTVNPRYYSAVDEVREEYAPGTAERYALGYAKSGAALAGQTLNGVLRKDEGGPSSTNPLGKLPGSVWTIPTQPLRVPDHISHARCCGGVKRDGCKDGIEHFAAFPMEWPRRIITGWSPREVCVECGAGRRPVVETERTNGARGVIGGAAFRPDGRMQTADGKRHEFQSTATITGYACACPDTSAPTTPGLVLDPFGGTGATALVADVLGRDAIHVDLSADYCRLAEWRTTDPGERARAMQVEKPAAVIDGQMDLLEGLSA